MRTSSIRFLAVALVLAVPSAVAAKLRPCPGGRYLVAGAPLTGVDDGSPMDAVEVAGRMVSIGSGCDPVKARVRATARGTKLRARWRACAGLEGRVVLAGTITEYCRTLNATFVAKSAGIVKPVVAALSACGDGIWDAAGGESCDAGLGPCGGLCNACACPGEATTTSTTMFGATTSTTMFGATTSTSTSTMPPLPTSSTTSTTLAGPDLRPHAWMSPMSTPGGVNVAIEYTVRNYGTATATGPWYDYIMLSGDYALGNDVAIDVSERVGNLSAGAQYTVLRPQVPIPDVPPGTYYLFLHTDGANAVAESNEPNNVGALVQLIVN